MESIAFYSYSGGVGRSELVVKTAWHLASWGKKVVVLDLDLESPSLHYKLTAGSWRPVIEDLMGAVPFLVALGAGQEPPDHLPALDAGPAENGAGRIRLVPAGNAPSPRYWKAVAQLNEVLDFSDAGGLAALLELKARIENELEPDVLLIDTRSGVTEIGGIAATLLADAVICLAPPFPEALDGTKAVIAGLRSAPRLAGQRPLQIFETKDAGEALGVLPQIFPAGIDPDRYPKVGARKDP